MYGFSRWIRLWSSPAMTSGLLLLLALLIVHGTLYQAVHGMYDARRHIFDAWIVLLGGSVPFPGVKLVLALLAANLVAAGIMRIGVAIRNCGMLLIHGGIALLLLGALGSSFFRTESLLSLGKGEFSATSVTDDGRMLDMPFMLTLNDFRISYFPGSDAPRDYESMLHVRGRGIDRDIVISMNRPFRYHDFTFYQASYLPNDTGMVSILSVVKNPFKAVPPIAGIIIALGLALHFLLKSRRLPGRSDA